MVHETYSSYNCQGAVQLCLVVISRDSAGKFSAWPRTLATPPGVPKTIVWTFAEAGRYYFDVNGPAATRDRIVSDKNEPLSKYGVRPCYPTEDPALQSPPVSTGRYWRCDVRPGATDLIDREYQIYFHDRRDGSQHKLDPTISNNGPPDPGGVTAMAVAKVVIRPGSTAGTFEPSVNPVPVTSDMYVSWQAPANYMFVDNGSPSSSALTFSDGSESMCWAAKTPEASASESVSEGAYFNCFVVASDAWPRDYTLNFKPVSGSGDSLVRGTLRK
jgi:hypothetical protein